MRWYALQVKTGKELDVRAALHRAGMAAKVPQEERPIRTNGVWVRKVYVLMPSYVFMGTQEFGAKEYYTAKAVPNIVRILGAVGGEPEAISHAEAEYIGLLAQTDEPLRPSIVRVENGKITPTAGILTRIPCRLLKIEPRRKRATVLLSLFGEEKAIELSVEVEGIDGEDIQAESEKSSC